MVSARSRRISSAKNEPFLRWILPKLDIVQKKNLRIVEREKKKNDDEEQQSEEKKRKQEDFLLNKKCEEKKLNDPYL